MQGREFTVVRSNTATSTAITVIQIATPATTTIELTRASCSQFTSTTSAMNRIQIIRKTGVATVTSATPSLVGPNSGASLCVGGVNLTGITATIEGTDDPTGALVDEAWNVLNGWLWVPTIEERIVVKPSSFIALKFPTAPASATYNCSVSYLEY